MGFLLRAVGDLKQEKDGILVTCMENALFCRGKNRIRESSMEEVTAVQVRDDGA